MHLELTSHVAGTEAAVEETAGRMTSILQLSSPSTFPKLLVPCSPHLTRAYLLTVRESLHELTFAKQPSAA